MPKHLPRVGLRLLLAVAGLVVGTLVALPFAAPIVETLLLPVQAALPGETHKLVFLSAVEPMRLYLKGPVYGGVFLAAPWILWQLRLLLAPERPWRDRAALLLVGLAALFYLGAAFAWWVVLPWALPRLLPAGIGGLPVIVGVEAAVALVVRTMVGCGLAFELPLVGAFLAIRARGPTGRGAEVAPG